MSKKKGWFNLIKRLFISETHSKLDKKEKKKKKKRWMFQRPKVKRLPPPQLKERTLNEAEEEHSKHALTVAIATAVVAEAAVASAQVATDVLGLTSTPQSTPHYKEKNSQSSAIDDLLHPSLSTHLCMIEVQDLAAIRIQTAFRGFLAKKALRALRGLVKLQAIIRGRLVRRQAITTLKRLQSIVNIQSQVSARRSQEECRCDEPKVSTESKDKAESNGQRRWDDSLLTKEETNTLFLSKREAFIKRERIKEYSYSHRRSTEPEQNKVNAKLRYLLEKWVNTQMSKREELEVGSNLSCANTKDEIGEKNSTLQNSYKQYRIEGLISPISVPRRSFHHRKQSSVDGDSTFLGSSPIIPTYMVATESAKAKARSRSSPKLRPGSFDSYSESNSPYKDKLSLVTNMTSDMRISYKQRSPSLKGVARPVKSGRTLKDLSFNSDCSALNWDRHNIFR